MLATNEVLQQGRYRIIHPSGQDGTGAIYEAYDNVRETNVLLKEILIKLKKVTTAAQLETLKHAFASEAKILTEIEHESFLRVHDYFSEIGRQYLVMEQVDGSILSEILEKSENPVSPADVSHWADQLLDALNYLHTRTPPVIHRDIKPQNVKLTPDGRIKLLASGLTQNSDARANATGASQTFDDKTLHYLPLEQILEGLDSASQKVITNSYDERSEQILKRPADARSDIYALAATLYHAVTGRLPIDALERSIDILEGKSDPLPAPIQLVPTIPPEISDLLIKAMEIRREKRFDSAVIMRQVLRTALVRVREREAEEAKKQAEEVSPIQLVEQVSPEPERLSVEPVSAEPESIEPENLEAKRAEQQAEEARRVELMQQQLREAEAQRLEAEQRAAEAERWLAEKRLLEKAAKVADVDQSSSPTSELTSKLISEPTGDELLELDEKPSVPVAVKASEDIIEIPHPVDAQPVAVDYGAAREQSSDEFEDLFVVPQKDNKAVLRIAAVAVILVMFTGAIWAVWNLLTATSAESNERISEQTTSLSNAPAPEPTVEAAAPAPIADIAPAQSVAATPEASAIPISSPLPTFTEIPAGRPAVRNKPLPPPTPVPTPRIKKQAAPPRAPANKKPVTVDDIISGN